MGDTSPIHFWSKSEMEALFLSHHQCFSEGWSHTLCIAVGGGIKLSSFLRSRPNSFCCPVTEILFPIRRRIFMKVQLGGDFAFLS